MSIKPRAEDIFPPLEIPYKLIIGCLLSRERLAIGLSLKKLEDITKELQNENGGYWISRTIIDRIEKAIGACQTEHIYTLCKALRHAGKQHKNKKIREYSQKITPSYIYSEADRHVIEMERFGLSVIAFDNYFKNEKDKLKNDEQNTLLKLIPQKEKEIDLHELEYFRVLREFVSGGVVNIFSWEICAPNLNFYYWKAIAEELDALETQPESLREIDKMESTVKKFISIKDFIPADLYSENESDLTQLNLSIWGMMLEDETSANVIKDRKSYLTFLVEIANCKENEFFIENNLVFEGQILEQLKSAVNYRLGKRSSPAPDYISSEYLKSGFKITKNVPVLPPLAPPISI